jgi:hypothetical protein
LLPKVPPLGVAKATDTPRAPVPKAVNTARSVVRINSSKSCHVRAARLLDDVSNPSPGNPARQRSEEGGFSAVSAGAMAVRRRPARRGETAGRRRISVNFRAQFGK